MKMVQQSSSLKKIKVIEAKQDGKPVYRAAKESKECYTVETLVNKTHVKISLVELDSGREVLSIVAGLAKEREALAKIVKDLAKNSYTISERVRVNYDLIPEIKYVKPEVTLTKAVATPFIEWYKNKLQELVGVLDEYSYSYISNNLTYTINDYEQKIVIDIKVSTGGIILAGNHRFIFSFKNKEYLYFFNKNLEKKKNSIRELFM
jgi:translation initiation factor 1 (eIF-1/SUI1)